MISWSGIRALPWRWIAAGAAVVVLLALLVLLAGRLERSGANVSNARHAAAALQQQDADIWRGSSSVGRLATKEREINDAEKRALVDLSAAGQRIDADSLREIHDADATAACATTR